MGTNYYCREKEPCPCCHREYSNVHIGKCSIGWVFIFQGTLNKTTEQWREYTKNKIIFNEYEDELSYEEFWERVENTKGKCTLKEDPNYRPSWDKFEYLDAEGYRFSNDVFS